MIVLIARRVASINNDTSSDTKRDTLNDSASDNTASDTSHTSYSVMVDGIQLGKLLSVIHKQISKTNAAIPKIAIHVRAAFVALGMVKMKEATNQKR